MNQQFWRNKRVFVTGHTGFKGSWLSLWLQSLGADVAGYALEPSTEPSLFRVAAVERGMTSTIGDITDSERLSRAMEAHEPEVVIHMAAQALVHASYTDPVGTYRTNVLGTVHLLEAVRHVPSVKVVVNVTTDKCYENREWVWGYRENEALGGYDPYSSSKACSELVTSAYRNSFFSAESYAQHGVALASARAGNVIGGGDWTPGRLVPDVMQSLLRGESALIRNPASIRPWQHVLEPLAGYLRLAESLYADGTRFASAWNFGPHDVDARPVSYIANRLYERWGGGLHWHLDEAEHPHEATYLKLDSSKARAELGWAPRLNLDKALDWIVDWTRSYAEGDDMARVTRQQIAHYQALVQGEATIAEYRTERPRLPGAM